MRTTSFISSTCSSLQVMHGSTFQLYRGKSLFPRFFNWRMRLAFANDCSNTFFLLLFFAHKVQTQGIIISTPLLQPSLASYSSLEATATIFTTTIREESHLYRSQNHHGISSTTKNDFHFLHHVSCSRLEQRRSPKNGASNVR
jgi:hypothetical protein